MVLPEAGAVGLRQQVHELAEEGEEIDLDDGDDRREHRRNQQQRPERPGVVPAEGEEARWRHVRLAGRERVDPRLEPGEETIRSRKTLQARVGKGHGAPIWQIQREGPYKPRKSGRKGAARRMAGCCHLCVIGMKPCARAVLSEGK